MMEEAREIVKLVTDVGLAGVIGLLLWRGLPALTKALTQIKDELIKALHDHSDKDMVHHEETRAAIGEVREELIIVKTRLEERGDATPVRGIRNGDRRG